MKNDNFAKDFVAGATKYNYKMEQIRVIYEDNHLIAVNKPAGWLVQGDITGDMPLSDWVKKYIKNRYKKPGDVFLGVIHRLDRPVSGVVVFARTSKALTRMNKLFQERKIEKTYWAIVNQKPADLSGKLVHYILKDKKRNIAKAYDEPSNRNKGSKRAELDYDMIGRIGDNYLLKVNPLTGRPHQIRVQLSKMDCPIRGDVKYGHKTGNQDGSICLHCKKLAFVHPVKKIPIEIEAETPNEQLWNLFNQ